MYVIVTKNVQLLVCLKKYNCSLFTIPQLINSARYQNEEMVITTDRHLAWLALIDGAKVYENLTMNGLVPSMCSKEELLDTLVDSFLEALGIRKAYNGYDYLKYMLKCNVKDDTYCLKAMGKEVYPECAKTFGVTPITVARTTNILLKKSYNRRTEFYNALYSKNCAGGLKEAPKVNSFIVVMADKIRNLIPNGKF